MQHCFLSAAPENRLSKTNRGGRGKEMRRIRFIISWKHACRNEMLWWWHLASRQQRCVALILSYFEPYAEQCDPVKHLALHKQRLCALPSCRPCFMHTLFATSCGTSFSTHFLNRSRCRVSGSAVRFALGRWDWTLNSGSVVDGEDNHQRRRSCNTPPYPVLSTFWESRDANQSIWIMHIVGYIFKQSSIIHFCFAPTQHVL